MTGIFSRNQVNSFKGLDRPKTNIIQVTNRGCYNIKYAAHAKECTLLSRSEVYPTALFHSKTTRPK